MFAPAFDKKSDDTPGGARIKSAYVEWNEVSYQPPPPAEPPPTYTLDISAPVLKQYGNGENVDAKQLPRYSHEHALFDSIQIFGHQTHHDKVGHKFAGASTLGDGEEVEQFGPNCSIFRGASSN
jgi:hypothetical protein